jgi:hypothetical protein
MTSAPYIPEGSTDYDPDEHAASIDAANGWKEPGEQPATCEPIAVSEQIRQFAAFLAPAADLSQATARAVGIRALALVWMANAGPCRGLTQRDVAERIGCTRATISHACREITQATGFRASGMRSAEAVEGCRALMQKRWNRRRTNDRHAARAGASLRTEPEAARWIDTLKPAQRRALLVEVGKLAKAPAMHAALQDLAASQPRDHAAALRIVRLHRAPGPPVSNLLGNAETRGLGVISPLTERLTQNQTN